MDKSDKLTSEICEMSVSRHCISRIHANFVGGMNYFHEYGIFSNPSSPFAVARGEKKTAVSVHFSGISTFLPLQKAIRIFRT